MTTDSDRRAERERLDLELAAAEAWIDEARAEFNSGFVGYWVLENAFDEAARLRALLAALEDE